MGHNPRQPAGQQAAGKGGQRRQRHVDREGIVALFQAGHCHQKGQTIHQIEGKSEVGQHRDGHEPGHAPRLRQKLDQGQQAKPGGQDAHPQDEHAAAAPPGAHAPRQRAGQGKNQGSRRVDHPHRLGAVAQAQQVQVKEHTPHAVPGQAHQDRRDQEQAQIPAEQTQHSQVRGAHRRSIPPFSRKGNPAGGTMPSPQARAAGSGRVGLHNRWS